MTPYDIKNKICALLDEKKAIDITVLDVAKLTVLADYFIVAGGTSTTNVRALSEYVADKLKEEGILPIRSEGLKDARWVVFDYGSVILHVLRDDMRLFYCIEKLWSDGGNIEKYLPKTKLQEKAVTKKVTRKKKEEL